MSEIKEILDEISEKIIPNEHWNKVREYITNLQEENERLKTTQIFIDTQDSEERCGQALYEEMLKRDCENYKQRINKANQLIEKQKKKMYKSRNKIAMYILINLENILRGDE